MRDIGHARARLRLESEPSSSTNNRYRPSTSNGAVRNRTTSTSGANGNGILNDETIYQGQSFQRQRTWDDDATLVGTTRGARSRRERLLMEQVREMEREEERERERRRNQSGPNGNLSPSSGGVGIWRRWWRRD